ncbi:PPE-repeat protein [Saccharothrix carnea]|uniref:PPE-repeat protein n=1 Tax=Saccharothrix carnea TaxID=1280637 RepID=A0A2P8IJD3_SACCR|nr:PPE domain-containing protein [Saccharothrix carnea]PSL58566.1 PPE-repeat protein [Saccharothrix carnea]
MATERVERDLLVGQARRSRDEDEPDLVLTETQNWASRSHRELYEAVHNNNDPGQTGEIGAEWGQFGTELTEAARLINERVAVSESGWTGDAADAARLAIKGLADWVTHTAETAVEVGKRVQDESQIMENARASMPEPVEFNWDQATGAFTAGGIQGLASSAADVQAANDHARALHEHAVTVMTTMERESQAVDQTTPRFSAPFNPVTGRTEEPAMLMRAMTSTTLAGAGVDGLSGGAGGSTATSSATATQPAQQMQAVRPMEPAQAYQPAQTAASAQHAGYAPGAAASYPGAPGSSGSGTYAAGAAPAAPPQQMYRPEGTTAAAAAAQVPVANPYTPPTGGGYGYTPPPGGGYNQPGGSGYVPPYQPANPNVAPRQGGGTLPPGVKPPNYIPAGSPGTPPVQGTPGGGGGGGGAGRIPGMPPGGFGGGGAGGFGGGAGGFGPTGSGGAGGGGAGSMAAGGSTGALGGQPARGPMPVGGFGPGGAAAAGAPMAGGAPMGGAPAGGQQGEDKEHRAAAYIRGEDIFEVPGENLPPSVIGGAKPKKKGDQS